MATDLNKISKYFSAKRVAIPIVIGFSVALYLLIKDFKPEAFSQININSQFFFYLLLAIFFLVLRDFFYMVRLRILTDNKISWKNSFQVIMLWEFTSAITPSVVGGSAVAMFIIHQEHISMGKSTAIVMITAIMDELFYVLAVPLTIIIAGSSAVFPDISFAIFGKSLQTQEMFWIGYSFIAVLIIILILGVFVSPTGFKKLVVSVFKLKLLKRWREKSEHFGDEIILTSKELKGKPLKYWASSFGVTMLSWTSRFLVVNALIAAFSVVNLAEHSLIFGRQLIMWVILLISPTPGGSGIAEFFFPVFLGDFITPGIATTLGFIWRLMTYYPYIFMGVIIFPLWVKRIMKHRNRKL